MTLHWPWALLASLVVVLLLSAMYLFQQRRARSGAIRFTNVELLRVIAPSSGSPKRHIVATLYLFGLAVLGIALGRPVIEADVGSRHATVVLAIDASLSMEATDMAPNRLAAAKQAAREFIDRAPRDLRIGLVSFSGIAQVLIPPTTNHSQVASSLSRISTGQGTAIGEAIYAALTSALSDSDRHTTDGTASILLMSDGENTVGRDPVQAAADATALGVRVSTVAIGTPTGVIVYRGQPVTVAVNESQLREIATVGGGEFFFAPSTQDLTAVYRDLGRAQAVERRSLEITALVASVSGVTICLAILLSLIWFHKFP